MRERLLLHDGENSGGLRRVGFHELHPRGRVVKQLPHQNCRAARASGRLLGQDLPRLQMQPDAVFRALRPREQVDLRHGRNSRQRLAPETKRADAGKILFLRILLVAWRRNAVRASTGSMPQPSSVMRRKVMPPFCNSIVIFFAPASMEFSTSSLTADAGRSTTSPAAMRSATWRSS